MAAFILIFNTVHFSLQYAIMFNNSSDSKNKLLKLVNTALLVFSETNNNVIDE